MFFDKDGKIRPINLRMLAQIPCVESNECKLADYLVDVLGDVNILKKYIASAFEKTDAQSNALEKFAASKLETKPLSRKREMSISGSQTLYNKNLKGISSIYWEQEIVHATT